MNFGPIQKFLLLKIVEGNVGLLTTKFSCLILTHPKTSVHTIQHRSKT